MIGLRARHSFAQFLELQPPTVTGVLLSKYGVQHLSLPHDHLLSALLNILRSLDERTIMHVLAEVIATPGDLRARVTRNIALTSVCMTSRNACCWMVTS